MENPKIVFHILTQSGYEAGLIEQTLRSADYDATFVYDDMTMNQGGYDVWILEPSLSEWHWLEQMTALIRKNPEIPIIVYCCDAEVQGDFKQLVPDAPVFIASDVTAVRHNLGVIIGRDVGCPKTVLFVDDDENIIKSYVRILRKSPWKILSTTSGENALEKLKDDAVDLIVTDIKMPNLHGLELISRIRETNKRIPIVICSAYPGMKDDDTLKFHDIAGFLEKPVDDDTLKTTLENLLQ